MRELEYLTFGDKTDPGGEGVEYLTFGDNTDPGDEGVGVPNVW